MNDDLKIIKKKYGEKMMQLCRELFNTILEKHPGVLPQILLSTFASNHFLYNDLNRYNYEGEFRNYIYSIYEKLDCAKEERQTWVADPVTLMKQAGYTLYECTTEEDIQKFKKYYAKGEELCTFKGGRLEKCQVYFALKDNAINLKRSDFLNPSRQDEYGTSVISIQFTRDKSHTLSIKNRYNHTVNNPDATFSNNLDNIIFGLTQSFADYYGLKQRYSKRNYFELFGYVRASDGRLYKYNYEIDNIYYCPDNIVIDNYEAKVYSQEKYLVMDYFILDLVNKKIINCTTDSFSETIGEIKKINIKNEFNQKKVTITPVNGEDIIIYLDEVNRIISLKNNNVESISDNFLLYNSVLEEVTLEKVTTIGNQFLINNHQLTEISLPNVLTIKDYFMAHSNIENINLPRVMTIGSYFLAYNYSLISIELPETETIGNNFLFVNGNIRSIVLPKVNKVGCYALRNVTLLTRFYAPKLRNLPSGCERLKVIQGNKQIRNSLNLKNNPKIKVKC